MKNINIRENVINIYKDKSGNFGMITALLLGVLIPISGVAIDLTGMMNTRAKMRDVSDAGALAAASALVQQSVTYENARNIALKYLKASSTNDFDISSGAKVSIMSSGTDTKKVYTVRVDTNYTYPLSTMTRFLKIVDQNIAATSTAKSGERVVAQTPLSIYFVLDRSGSMKDKTSDGKVKIEALKSAVSDLGKSFNSIDPDEKYIRTGADAFSSEWVEPTDLDWGSAHVVSYAKALKPNGFTIPMDALDEATKSLSSQSENKAHLAKNGGIPKKAIIYMTDGRNWLHDGQTKKEQIKIDNEALDSCNSAKEAGIEVFTIGFDISKNGEQFLTDCSSGADHFYFPKSATDLTSTFKTIGEQVSSLIKPRIAE